MKALLDMPVSASLLSVLEARGHEGVHASQLGLDRAPDQDLLALARREGRVVITADLDLPRMLALSAAEGPGLILFRGGTYSDEEMRVCWSGCSKRSRRKYWRYWRVPSAWSITAHAHHAVAADRMSVVAVFVNSGVRGDKEERLAAIPPGVSNTGRHRESSVNGRPLYMRDISSEP